MDGVSSTDAGAIVNAIGILKAAYDITTNGHGFVARP